MVEPNQTLRTLFEAPEGKLGLCEKKSESALTPSSSLLGFESNNRPLPDLCLDHKQFHLAGWDYSTLRCRWCTILT